MHQQEHACRRKVRGADADAASKEQHQRGQPGWCTSTGQVSLAQGFSEQGEGGNGAGEDVSAGEGAWRGGRGHWAAIRLLSPGCVALIWAAAACSGFCQVAPLAQLSEDRAQAWWSFPCPVEAPAAPHQH